MARRVRLRVSEGGTKSKSQRSLRGSVPIHISSMAAMVRSFSSYYSRWGLLVLTVISAISFLLQNPLESQFRMMTNQNQRNSMEVLHEGIPMNDNNRDSNNRSHAEPEPLLTSIQESQNKSSSLLLLTPRAFLPWENGHPMLCEKQQPLLYNHSAVKSPDINYRQGLLYIRVAKASSSTTSGINLRMARNMARRLYNKNNNETDSMMCQATHSHKKALSRFRHLRPQKAFVWTMIREPTARAISSFFHFQVSRRNVSATDISAFRNELRESRNFYGSVLGCSKAVPRNATTAKPQALQEVIERYNFIGIMERFDESMVVLSTLLDVPLEDVIYLKAKTSGGYDDGAYQNKCFRIIPKSISPGMQAYFESEEWNTRIHLERTFYEVANQSLDLTIDQLWGKGQRDVFQAKLNRYRNLQARVEEQCAGKVVFPCSPSGELTPLEDRDCFRDDVGCGATCLDRVVLSS